MYTLILSVKEVLLREAHLSGSFFFSWNETKNNFHVNGLGSTVELFPGQQLLGTLALAFKGHAVMCFTVRCVQPQ